MAKCYMTNMIFSIDQAYVLNKRAVLEAIKKLKNQTNGLKHILKQLGPSDKVNGWDQKDSCKFVKNNKRLICKAMAAAIAESYPGIDIFIPLVEYRAELKLIKLKNLEYDGLYGSGIRALKPPHLIKAAVLGHQILRKLDPARQLHKQAATAILAGVCVSLYESNHTEVIGLIKSAVEHNKNLDTLGVPHTEQKNFLKQMRQFLYISGETSHTRRNINPTQWV